MTTRGLLNKNPGNVRRSAIRWQGMADVQSDPDFITFKSDEYGIRTICRILLTYNNRGLNTCRKIINEWAPPVENNTSAYVDDVSSRCEIGPDDELDVDQADVMRSLVKAIIQHENGVQPYADSAINDGMRLAGVSDIKPAPIMASNTSKGATIATVGTVTAAASEGIRQAQDVRDTIDQASDLMRWTLHFGPFIAFAFVFAGLALLVYDHLQKRKKLGV